MRNRVKLFFRVQLIGMLLLGCTIYYNYRDQRSTLIISSIDEFVTEKNNVAVTKKKILYWTKWFGSDYPLGKGEIFANCPTYSRYCEITKLQTHEKVEDYDALFIHNNNVFKTEDLPKNSTRKTSQHYIYVNLESPVNSRMPLRTMDDGYFNLTMTYRLDSDVFWPYGNIRELKTGSYVAPSWNPDWKTDPIVATGVRKKWNKTKTAMWFVSNCRAKSKRANYVRELAKHVDVDVIGRCGNKTGCPRNRDCFGDIVEPNYYFYLSFENSMCDDYVTEKLYTALKYDVVPVVYGGANYSRFAPPGSYINALDFDSPEELGNHLKDLIRRPEAYAKLFDWKLRYESVDSTGQAVCDLCRYLHDNDSTTKIYSTLGVWWATDRCRLQRKLKNLPYLTKRDVVEKKIDGNMKQKIVGH